MEMKIYSSGLRTKTVYTLKNPDGSEAGRITVTKSGKKKAKRLNYNFKRISAQILRANTSGNAKKVVTKAHIEVGQLQRKLKCGEFDDKEIELAILHAKRIERAAKKREKNLRKEEEAERRSGNQTPLSDEERFDWEEQETSMERSSEEMEKEIERLQELIEKMTKQSMKEMEQDIDGEDVSEALYQDMEPEELERVKKKHRSSELRDIVEADMKYLKALFQKLQKEKEALSNGSGVSLELSGNEVPVQMPETPVTAEGENIDLSV